MKVQTDLGKSFAKFSDDLGQYVTRLSVSRRDRKRAFFFLIIVGRKAANVFGFAHDNSGAIDHLMTGSSDATQTLALASEQLHAELFFEQLQLFADAGLARVHAFGSSGDVQSVVDNRQ